MDSKPIPSSSGSYSAELNDYSKTVTDVGKSTNDFLWKKHPVRSFFTIVLPILASIVVYSINSQYEILSILLLIISFGFYWSVRSRMQRFFYTELATELNCSYMPDGEVPKQGQLFTFGDTRTVSNVLSGSDGATPFRLADYSYTIRNGKDHDDSFYFTIGELTFSGTLPRIVCRPKSWAIGFLDQWKPSGFRQLPLEGNFDSEFTVYVPESKETEALQVLQSDVMAKLMDGFNTFGFESIGSTIYFFTQGRMGENRDEVLKLVSLLKRFHDLLTPELQSFMRESVKQI